MDLKAQWKFFTASRNNKTCDKCNAGNWETMQHFLFKCDKYVNSRAVWLTACRRILRTTAELNSWNQSNDDAKLRTVLFPYVPGTVDWNYWRWTRWLSTTPYRHAEIIGDLRPWIEKMDVPRRPHICSFVMDWSIFVRCSVLCVFEWLGGDWGNWITIRSDVN